MSGSANNLMARIEQAKSRLQVANGLLSEIRGMLNPDLDGGYGEIGDGFSSFFERLKDEVSDTWDSITNPIETTKDTLVSLQEAVDNPEQALRETWDSLKAPYDDIKESWNEGREGEAIGRGLAEAVLLFSPTKYLKGLKGLGASSGDDGADNDDSAPDEDRAGKLDEATRDWHVNARQHIFQGNFDPATGMLAGGLHTQAGLDAFLKRKPEFEPISRETLQNGVERVEFPPEALTNKAQTLTAYAASTGRGIPNGKTIFPGDWDENKIADALNQTKDKGVPIASTPWGGVTKALDVNGVKVEVSLDQNGKVTSGYPSWNQ